MSQSITKNAFYNVLLNIASVIFPLITAPYISRVLEPEGVGIFNFANTYAGYFALVAMLGIPTYGVREVAKRRDDKDSLTDFISQMLSISVITTACVSIVYLITIAVVGKLTENYIIFLLSGFVIYLAPLKINWYYQGVEDFGFITKVSLLIRTLSVICLFLFVKDRGDLVVYVILSVLGSVLADLWNFVNMLKSGIRPKLSFEGVKQHINPLLVLFASSIAISIYTVLDTLMLGFIRSYEEVGYYTYAMHISKVILSAVTSLSIVAVPRVSFYMKNGEYDNINQLMNKSFAVVSFLAFPIAIGLLCISPVFVPLFFGVKFVGSVVPLMILSVLIIVIGLNNLTGTQILIGMGHDRLFLYSVIVGTVSNLIMNSIFIPIWGAVGASVASVIAEILILIISILFVRRFTKVRISEWKDIFKAFVGAIVFFPLLFVLQKFVGGWLLVGAFVLLGGSAYIAIEYFLRNSSIALFNEVIINRIRNKIQKV